VVDELEKCIRRMFAPIVVFRGFEDLVTEEMKARITVERLADPFSNTATDYEAMVYLHTASLAVPFSEDWRNIYMYLFSKYYPTHAERIGVYKDKLTEQEKRKLKDLKKWIYKQQMNSFGKKFLNQ